MSGKNNGNYIHGNGYAPYTKEFTQLLRNEIKERDNHKCQYCGLTQEEHKKKYSNYSLEIHHIDYDRYNCDKENLITLCKQCNINANFNIDYYYAFYTYKMDVIYEK
jgi:5-methylcytosine-specific restriction endonuclease McrA